MTKRQKTVELLFIFFLILSIVVWISSNLFAPYDMSTAGFTILGFFGSIFFCLLTLAYPAIILWKNKRKKKLSL